jgi:hypothetical protein
MSAMTPSQVFVDGKGFPGFVAVSYDESRPTASEPLKLAPITLETKVPRRAFQRAMPSPCWKCFDGRTRGHNRYCPRRGARGGHERWRRRLT